MSQNILEDLDKFKDKYYSENKKKSVFNRKSQKYEMAKELLTKFDINLLLQKTAYVIPESNKLFVNYQIFKQFAHPDNYELFVKYVQSFIPPLISKYNTFECHVDIDTFTISAAERYKGVIQVFCRDIFEVSFTDHLDGIYIYNPPTMLDKISIIILKFLEPATKEKIRIVSKSNSKEIVEKLKSYSFRRTL